VKIKYLFINIQKQEQYNTGNRIQNSADWKTDQQQKRNEDLAK